MERHSDNAAAIAERLQSHPAVERVIYPGLASHPEYALARRQMRSGGGMLSVVIAGGLERARRFLERVEIFALAESLGGVDSLMAIKPTDRDFASSKHASRFLFFFLFSFFL